LRQPFLRPYTSITGGDTRHQPYVGSVTIAGPFEASGARPVDETPSRRRILVCRPTPGDIEDEARCARQIFSALARRACRSPVTKRDLEVLLDCYDDGHADGGFKAGIELGLRRLLASPEFLFRLERDPAGVEPSASYRISDLEIASRLSFFLWSSVPDDELLDAAIDRTLHEPEVLETSTAATFDGSRWSTTHGVAARARQPMENNPRVVCERLFGEGGTTEQRVAEMRRDRSFLDSVTADLADLQRDIGAGDRARVAQYLVEIRALERRIQLAEVQSADAREGWRGQTALMWATSRATPR